MCVGCRTRAPKGSLLRVVRTPDGNVRSDRTGRAAGRGAYVHRTEDCLARATRSAALGRALRAGLGPVEAASLMKELREAIGEHA